MTKEPSHGRGVEVAEFKVEVKDRRTSPVGGEAGRGAEGENNCFATRWRVFVFLAVWQSIFIILFGVFVDYDDTALPPPNGTSPTPDNPIGSFYPMFQDIHVMMFVGFGFLMTFLKRYGFSSVGFNFLVAAFVLQWSTLIFGFLHWHDGRYINISVKTIIISDFAAASVLIAMGAVLGKVNHIQLCMMAAIQVVLQQINEWIGVHLYHATDVGESVYVHAFGAYFGLAVSRVLFRRHVHDAEHMETSVYHSDLFAMIGSVFLWMYWPSFNAGGIEVGDRKHRTVLNTYFSLAACCVVTFALSALLDKDKKSKFNMVHIQNSTLAGGVAVGTTSDMVIHPYGALLTGTVAAILSVLGFRFLTPFLNKKLGIHDTCGVNNLHGMPGIMAGLSGILVSGIATYGVYQNSLYDIWPARDPSEMADPRTAGLQAAYQAAALATTLAIALVGGAVTGLILKLPIWGQPREDQIFDDTDFWEMPEDGFPAAIHTDYVHHHHHHHVNPSMKNGHDHMPHPILQDVAAL